MGQAGKSYKSFIHGSFINLGYMQYLILLAHYKSRPL